jgi:hypothetical protein
MSDTYTETTTTSWGSRIKSAFTGIFFGILLIVGGIVLLFWNEGRTVKNKRALNEGEKNVISVQAESVSPANEAKLVHFSGLATTGDTLVDDEFGISALAIQLERKVEMYQWEENEESSTKKKLGGSEETTTTYKYKKEWSTSLNKSSEFKVPENHENPAEFPYNSSTLYASNVTVGAFRLSNSLIQRISNSEPLQVSKLGVDSLKNVSLNNSVIYYGEGSPSKPKIGDVKITYTIVKPQEVSIVGKQTGNTIDAYTAKNGKTVLLLQGGKVEAEKMFETQKASNSRMGWILRAVGFLMISMGFGAIFKLLSVLADVVPFIGNIVSFGTSIISAILAFAISFIVIAIAWIYYRPVIGISLLVIGAISLIYIFVIAARKKKTA